MISGLRPILSLNLPKGIVKTTVDAVMIADAIAISKRVFESQILWTTMKYGQAIDMAKEKKTATKENLRNSPGRESSLRIGGNLRGPFGSLGFS